MTGASIRTLARRAAYGGRKGRAAIRRLWDVARRLRESLSSARSSRSTGLPRGWFAAHTPGASPRISDDDMGRFLYGLGRHQPPPVGPGEYRCAQCQGVYKKGRPDAEAAAEAREIFAMQCDENDQPPPGAVVVCDDCFVARMGPSRERAPS